MALRVVFLHGLEGSPNGAKAQRLRTMREVEVVAPQLDAGELIAWRTADPGRTTPPVELLHAPLEVARCALRDARPQLVVGSSFGGGLAMKLAVDGTWIGPLVLLSPAGERLFGALALPRRAGRVVVVHGRADEVVQPEHSVSLAQRSACEVVLWLVNDDHRLSRSVDEGVLDAAVRLATAP